MPKTICVFAGSSSGGHPQYVQAARELGRELVARNYGLVYELFSGSSLGCDSDLCQRVCARLGVPPSAGEVLCRRS
jgi:cytokinin riboside 5'-monophosphate phosphoribohydrolase